MVWQRGQNLGRREGDVQKESHAVGMAAPTQHRRDRDHVVVVDPDQIVFLDDLLELGGEVLVDAKVAAQIAAREFRKVEPVVQDRPQHAIGETVVIFLKIVAREVGDDIFDVLVLDGSRFPLAGGDFAAPAQPDAAILLQSRPQSDLKSAGALCAVAGRNRNPI